MHRADAYAALNQELDLWRQRTRAELAASVDRPASAREVKIKGELVSIEVSASWANPERTAVRLNAVAYGPSHWRMEQLSEGITVLLENT
jgi:hypothetical protein